MYIFIVRSRGKFTGRCHDTKLFPLPNSQTATAQPLGWLCPQVPGERLQWTTSPQLLTGTQHSLVPTGSWPQKNPVSKSFRIDCGTIKMESTQLPERLG